MSLRTLFCGFICLTLISAANVNSTNAQPRAKTAKLVRVSYAVADLITPIEDRTAFRERKPLVEAPAITSDSLVRSLKDLITNTVAKDTWANAGGTGDIQYFPAGMAIIVNQTQEVQEEIADLLAALRRMQEVQVSIETRLVTVASKGADQILKEMDQHGKPVRMVKDPQANPGKQANRSVTVDEKRTFKLLEMVHGHRFGAIAQMPSVTLFNGQRAGLESTTRTSPTDIRDGIRCDFLPVADAERKNVRLHLDLEHVTQGGEAAGITHRHVTTAVGTFAVPTGHTLVWHLGETTSRNQLFLMATPRVLIVKEEERVFLGQIPGRRLQGDTEEQSVPEPKRADTQLDPKEKAIKDRLRRPISFSFKDMPLKQVIKDLAIISGVQVVPDMRALNDARIDMDSPVSCQVTDVDMKFALSILLNPLRLCCVIENQVLMITVEARSMGTMRVTYPVSDLVKPMATLEGQKLDGPPPEESLIKLITNTVGKNSWVDAGGHGTIQYLPKDKKLVVSQPQEIQEEIELLLATLRRLRDLAVCVDVRFLHTSADGALVLRKEMAKSGTRLDVFRMPDSTVLSDGAIKRNFINLLSGSPPPVEPEATKAPTSAVAMSNTDVQQWLDLAQTRQATTIAEAPSANLWNGQKLSFECLFKRTSLTEFRAPNLELDGKDHSIVRSKEQKNESGWRYEVKPIVSPDRRSIRMELKMEHFVESVGIESTTKATGIFALNDQRTLVWHIGETARHQHLFVLVTPRIQVREEPEKIVEETPPIPGR